MNEKALKKQILFFIKELEEAGFEATPERVESLLVNLIGMMLLDEDHTPSDRFIIKGMLLKLACEL